MIKQINLSLIKGLTAKTLDNIHAHIGKKDHHSWLFPCYIISTFGERGVLVFNQLVQVAVLHGYHTIQIISDNARK